MQLGSRLRGLREAKGISREAAGYAIRASESKISRMELGRVGFKPRDIADLLSMYGVSEPEREVLTALAQEANSPGWWQPYGDLLATWFQNYLDLEAAATLIRRYELQFVPGLLQTEEYARGHPARLR
jgi:transcriptional regulator with XRE-family HTH domain